MLIINNKFFIYGKDFTARGIKAVSASVRNRTPVISNPDGFVLIFVKIMLHPGYLFSLFGGEIRQRI